MEQNLALTSSRLGADIARDDVRVAFGGHLPQVDLVRRQVAHRKRRHRRLSRRSRAFPPAARAVRTQDSDTDKSHQPAGDRAHLVERRHAFAREAVRIPLAGRQAAPRARVARNRAHRARCLSRRRCRKSRACRRSSRRSSRRRTALRATEAGYDVGTRTAVDVLAARQHAGAAQTDVLAQPLRLHAQRAAPQAGRRHPRSQGARRREHAGWRLRRRRRIRRSSRRPRS